MSVTKKNYIVNFRKKTMERWDGLPDKFSYNLTETVENELRSFLQNPKDTSEKRRQGEFTKRTISIDKELLDELHSLPRNKLNNVSALIDKLIWDYIENVKFWESKNV